VVLLLFCKDRRSLERAGKPVKGKMKDEGQAVRNFPSASLNLSNLREQENLLSLPPTSQPLPTGEEMHVLTFKAQSQMRNVVAETFFPSMFPITKIVHPQNICCINIFVSEKQQMFCGLYGKERSHYFPLVRTLKKH